MSPLLSKELLELDILLAKERTNDERSDLQRLNDKIDDMKEAIKELKRLAEKLEKVFEKIQNILPLLMRALVSDDSPACLGTNDPSKQKIILNTFADWSKEFNDELQQVGKYTSWPAQKSSANPNITTLYTKWQARRNQYSNQYAQLAIDLYLKYLELHRQ